MDLGVSRETMERLTHFAELLEKWNPAINLVSRSSIPDLWARHMRDSLQLVDMAERRARIWADLGSGGGFPGLVIAILNAERELADRVVLVESDARKCAFLTTVLRETGVTAGVVTARIEALPPLGAEIVTARALADLPTLLGFMERHGGDGTIGLFPKGKTWQSECDSARRDWHFELAALPSTTDPSAVVLRIGGLCRV